MNEVDTMLNDAVKKVSKLFELQTKIINLADIIITRGDEVTFSELQEYRLMRNDLDDMKYDMKHK